MLTDTNSQYPAVSKTMYPNFPENAKWKKYDKTISKMCIIDLLFP